MRPSEWVSHWASGRWLDSGRIKGGQACSVCFLQFLANRSQSVTAVEDVIQDEYMSINHIGQGDLFENHFATRLRFAVITRHAQAIQPHGQRNSPHQVRHEYETAIQDYDHGQFAIAIIVRDLRGDLIEPPQNCRLVKQHALEIGLHRSLD